MRLCLAVLLLCIAVARVDTQVLHPAHVRHQSATAKALRPSRLSPGFREVASRVAVNNTLLVTFANRGYAHFVQNMVATLRRQGVDNTLVFALDAEAEKYFKEAKISATYFVREYGTVSPDSQLFNAEVTRDIAVTSCRRGRESTIVTVV